MESLEKIPTTDYAKLYKTLYSNYKNALSKSYESNSNFSASRQRCWNACSE